MQMIIGMRSALLTAAAISIAACDQVNMPASMTKPTCASERAVEGWTVTASLEKSPSGDALLNKWEAKRNYSTFFGLRITFDTSVSAAPFLQVWHDYKTGEFLMRFEDFTHFRLQLDARYAVSYGVLPDAAFKEISRRPVRIEHTSHTNKWTVYTTDGLPEAIAAAIADLDSMKQRLTAGECKAS